MEMMDYGSWLNHGGLDNNRYYNRCKTETQLFPTQASLQQRNDDDDEDDDDEDDDEDDDDEEDDENDENIDETTNSTAMRQSSTSGDRSSTSADIFRLEFAATQWSKLVTNAEGLFNKLMINNSLPNNEQDQIEQWLCLKQEYEECITSDETLSLRGYQEMTKRSLERIDEVTEIDESRNEELQSVDVTSKLRKKMRNTSIISEMSEDDDDEDDEDEEEDEEDRSDASSSNPDFLEKLDDYMKKFKNETDLIVDTKKYDLTPTNFEPLGNITKINDTNDIWCDNNNRNNNNNYVPIIRPVPLRNPNSRRNSMLPGSEMCNEIASFNETFRPSGNNRNHEISTESETPQETRNNDSILRAPTFDKILPKRVALQSPGFQETKIVAKNSRTLQKYSETETAKKLLDDLQIAKELRTEEIRNVSICEWPENHLDERHEWSSDMTREDEIESCRTKCRSYVKMALIYEKKLRDMETMSKIASFDTAKKVLELEESLGASRKQTKSLEEQLRREEQCKRRLEHELIVDQTKIRTLEEKYDSTALKLRDLRERDTRTNKRENTADEEKKNLFEVRAKITHLDRVLREKSMNLELITDTNDKEKLRREIRSLRKTRDRLIDEKCELDEKLQKQRSLSFMEEGKLLICGEAIETIDAIIEAKNVAICGNDDKKQDEKSELQGQLEKLPYHELVILFDKYFRKVIEVKQNARSVDERNAEIERQLEWKDRGMRLLGEKLRRTECEAKRRIYEVESEVNRLRRRLAEYETPRETGTIRATRTMTTAAAIAATAAATTTTAGRSNVMAGTPRIVQRELKKIAPKTKVTRERNKLIIQRTMDSDRRTK